MLKNRSYFNQYLKYEHKYLNLKDKSAIENLIEESIG